MSEIHDWTVTCNESARELGDVALQMLRADLVERALVRPFQHRPVRLNAVRVRHAADVLTDRVLDGLVVEGDAVVGGRIVGVDRRLSDLLCK